MDVMRYEMAKQARGAAEREGREREEKEGEKVHSCHKGDLVGTGATCHLARPTSQEVQTCFEFKYCMLQEDGRAFQ